MKKWDDELWLLTPDEFNQLNDGVKLKSINEEVKTKGVDNIDLDTRFGCIAYGLTKNLAREQNLENDFLILLLKS